MAWIDECLKSILNSSIVPNIFIVDNKSSDETVTFLRENYNDKIILHESENNLGFGKANNIGLTYALEHNYNFTFLLNQDAFLELNTLQHLIHIANTHKEFGIISPIHLNVSGEKLESYFSDFINYRHYSSFYFDHIINSKINEIYSVSFVNAAAWLIPMKILKEIGGFDPIFWHYGEDDNYCQRVLFHGYKIGIVPKSFIRHDSRIRENESKNLFNEKYYLDYVKNLQTKYGNINYEFNVNILNYEKKQVFKDILKSIFNLKFKYVLKYLKKISFLNKVIPDIINSRKLNALKAPRYLIK